MDKQKKEKVENSTKARRELKNHRRKDTLMKQEQNTNTHSPLERGAGVCNDIISSLFINGDISRLTPSQKVNYYRQVCDKLGLDPLSQPFRILRLHGREIMYCDRGGAQQLNKLHRVSHEIRSRETVNGCYVVTAQASTPDGRKTESLGAVPITNLKGETLCNAMMKAETKAKRRATLDLLGLGILDETETEQLYGEIVKLPALDNDGIISDERKDDNGIPTSLFMGMKGLTKAVATCTTEEELLQLYNDNKDRIDGAPQLKQLFTTRKNELRKTAA
ncbi:MAG: hypothetical protein JNK00_05215 [Flavipsychrobacter sp.]|nr:hypothetical protein [Flavipsychrobacter sp.]